MQDGGQDQVPSLMAIKEKAEVLIQSNYDWLLIVHQFYYSCISVKYQYFFSLLNSWLLLGGHVAVILLMAERDTENQSLNSRPV